MLRTMTIAAVLLMLAACNTSDKRDYDAAANCDAMGYTSGNAAYDTCMREEKSNRMMQEQQREYEQMKQQQQDYKMRQF